jgi:hypothetical protein
MRQLNPLLLIAVFVLVLFAAALGVGFFAPIYFDDLGHIIGCSRIGYDGWEAINNQPLCYSNFSTPVPILLMPGRWLSWLLHSVTPDFMMLRVSAVVIFAIWFAVASWLFKRLFMTDMPWLYSSAFIASLCGLGLLPMVMLQGRPEAALLLCITLYIAIPVWLQRNASPSAVAIGVTIAAMLMMASWFFTAHSKSLLYLPLALACCWHLPFARHIRLALMGTTTIIAIQSMFYWVAKLSCEAPKIASFRSEQGLLPDLLLNEPLVFIQRFADNLGHSYYYLNKILFLPPQLWTSSVPKQWWMAYINPLILWVGALIALLVCVGMIRLLYGWLRSEKQYVPYGGIMCWLMAGLLAQDGLQVFKSFYETTLVWPCLILLAGFAAAMPSIAPILKRYRHLWLSGLFILSAVSMTAFISAYMPATYKLMTHAPSDRILMRKSHAIAPVHYDAVAKRTIALAARCGIYPDNRSHAVVVDSVTYLAMRKTYAPLYQPFYQTPESLEQLYQIIRHYHSDGLITACRHLPPKLRNAAKKNRGICCLPKGYFVGSQNHRATPPR